MGRHSRGGCVMNGNAKKSVRATDPLQDYFRVIRRTNETGLAGRDDYEVAFGAMASEEREGWIAWAPYLALLREAGVYIGGVGVVAAFRPDEDLPSDIVQQLERIDQVVEATPTQVLHMREQGGQDAADF